MPPASPPADACTGTGSKPRSGFARQKIKIERLTAVYENLQLDHEQLQADHERLQATHDKLEVEYRQLEAAFAEITQLKPSCLPSCGKPSSSPPAPYRPAPSFGSLMGIR
jgi:hypothetical protein